MMRFYFIACVLLLTVLPAASQEIVHSTEKPDVKDYDWSAGLVLSRPVSIAVRHSFYKDWKAEGEIGYSWGVPVSRDLNASQQFRAWHGKLGVVTPALKDLLELKIALGAQQYNQTIRVQYNTHDFWQSYEQEYNEHFTLYYAGVAPTLTLNFGSRLGLLFGPRFYYLLNSETGSNILYRRFNTRTFPGFGLQLGETAFTTGLNLTLLYHFDL